VVSKNHSTGRHPRVLYGCANKRVAGRGICKKLKTKALESGEWREKATGVPPPRVFCTKRLQAIENKRRELRKERQENSRGGNLLKMLNLPQRRRARRVGRSKSGGEARIERGEKSIQSVGERIVVSAGFAVGGLDGRFFFRFASSRFAVASRFEPPQRLRRGLRYARGYAKTTGRRDGLGAGG
jgi:hypothetical protein